MSTTFLQQILSDRILLVVIDGKIKKKKKQQWVQIRIGNNLPSIICYENVENIELLILFN